MIQLFINTQANQLIGGLNTQNVVNPLTLPFYAGDSGLVLQVYLMTPLATNLPSQFNFSVIPTTGNTLFAQIDNNAEGSGAGQIGNPYTSQNTWATDPTNSYFYAYFPMNTAALQALVTAQNPAPATLRIGYFNSGLPLTVLSVGIQVLPGIPGTGTAVPPPLTGLSVQVANTLYVLQNGLANGQPGAGFFLTTPLGKKIYVQAVDNGDGTASFQASPSN